jgi:hypothetical protein
LIDKQRKKELESGQEEKKSIDREGRGGRTSMVEKAATKDCSAIDGSCEQERHKKRHKQETQEEEEEEEEDTRTKPTTGGCVRACACVCVCVYGYWTDKQQPTRRSSASIARSPSMRLIAVSKTSKKEKRKESTKERM